MKCCFCKKEIKNLGNNANPLKNGRCCDECNKNIVIPHRLAVLIKTRDLEKEEKENE